MHAEYSKLAPELRDHLTEGLTFNQTDGVSDRMRENFARFHFADLSARGAELEPLIEKSFLAMCRQDGVKAALEAFMHTEHARKVHAFWRSHQAAWWKPEELWQQACDALRDTRMFPPDAFDSPDSQAEQSQQKRRRLR